MLTTSRARRLLVLLPSGRFGGAEAHTLRVADAAAAAGMAVTLAAGSALHPVLEGRGHRIMDAALAWRRGLPETARRTQAEAARTALVASSPELALLPLPWPDQAGGAMEALAEAGTPSLVVSHLAPPGDQAPAGLDPEALAAAAAMRADWVAVSAPTAARLERFLRLPPGRVTTIPNGVDPPAPLDRAAARTALRALLGVSPETPVALFLGRLDAAKGADHLPELAQAFARRTGGVIACAGAGTLEETLRRAAPVGHPLRLLGRLADPAPLLAGADLLALPSRLEGAPLAFLEAAGHLLPVAASPAALEALGNAAPGMAFLADPEDLAAMADALAACLDPAIAGPRTEAAWRLAASWDGAAMADRYLARLRGLLLGAPRAPAA
ncbi:glycosyltransferase [Pararoseomonas indoligenes]|uniref:Glycosyltransferase n=1 Tax=Roseomonas indoligenes TaxID=2820811 RepID=A0A940MV85_9PROT|nr:glycosyltransferase [Pararoseomonas indoligenes]MBP0494793.1 glycosyltransferase [Pararoseomonas indoligenes]